MKKNVISKNRFYFFLGCFLIIFILGCALDRSGLSPDTPSTICHVYTIDYKVNPVEHQYQFEGACMIGSYPAAFYVSSQWKKGRTASQTEAKADLQVTYRGQTYRAQISAKCPDGDPFIYDVSCSDRKITWDTHPAELWAYYAIVFEKHMMPVIFKPEQKAALRAEAEWADTPPIFLYPTPTKMYTYENPKKVLIFIKLPFAKGNLSKWKIHFQYQKWIYATKGSGGHWGTPITNRIDNLYKSSGGDFVGRKSMEMAPGKYKIWAWSKYAGLWESKVTSPPVEFYVRGTIKRMKPKRVAVKLLSVASPNGGETWFRTMSPTIKWIGVPITNGSFVLTSMKGIPNGSNYRIRVKSLVKPTVFDDSDANFTIKSPTMKMKKQ